MIVNGKLHAVAALTSWRVTSAGLKAFMCVVMSTKMPRF
jgi:hypothetical protein